MQSTDNSAPLSSTHESNITKLQEALNENGRLYEEYQAVSKELSDINKENQYLLTYLERIGAEVPRSLTAAPAAEFNSATETCIYNTQFPEDRS